MSWTDRESIRTMCKLRDTFGIKEFIETGTYRGLNAETHASNFQYIGTCEVNHEYFKIAQKRLKDYLNVFPIFMDSSRYLKYWQNTKDTLLFYLDAHFFVEGSKTNEERFVVLKELKSLENRTNSIIAIHDFDNNEFGHITYDGISLDLPLLKDSLLKVNPNFSFYTNTECDIMKVSEAKDADMLDNLRYAWSKPDKGKRGILYCLPEEINPNEFKLREIGNC